MADACSICGGTGFAVSSSDGGTSTATRCVCSATDPKDVLKRAACIPRRYDHCTFEEFSVQTNDKHLDKALTKVKEWVTRWPLVDHGLVLYGTPGTGKTHLAVASSYELIAKKTAKVRFYEQRDLLTEIQGTFRSQDHGGTDGSIALDRGDVLAPVLDAQLLVLDDLGAGRPTWWAREVLHDIITYRYNHELPLIITTNRPLEPEDIKNSSPDKGDMRWETLRGWLGDALLSRLYEMCIFVQFRGDDFRQKMKRAEYQY